MIINVSLKDSIQTALKDALSYVDFRLLVNKLIKEGKSTGHTQNDEMLNYSKLSERRIKRWDKTFKMNAEDKKFFQNWSKPLLFLTIAEGWCGDAAHALPILNHISETAPNLDLQIVLRDDHDDLMQEFLTNGGKSIPKLIALNDEQEVLFTWGPRPSEAAELVRNFKDQHGQLTPEFKEDLQKWYNKDKGQGIVEDLKILLNSLK